MPSKNKSYRLTLHVEGRGDSETRGAEGATADFEKILCTEVRGEVSREHFAPLVCDCICEEQLLHEDSMEVASLVGVALDEGTVVDAQPGAVLPLVGRDTSAKLQLAVSHTLIHGDVALGFGALCVAVPGAQIDTAAKALRMDCRVGDQRYVVSAQLTPSTRGAYSECYRQKDGACIRERVAPIVPRTQGAQPGTLSHRNHRRNCKETHSCNVQHATQVAAAQQPFCTREVLSRKVALLSTAGLRGATTVHTVFFR